MSVTSLLNQKISPREWFKDSHEVITPSAMRGYGDRIGRDIAELERHIKELKEWQRDAADLAANECVKNE